MAFFGFRFNRYKLVLPVVICFSLCFSACDWFSSRADYTPDGKRIIVFWHAMGGPLGEVLEGLIERYNNSQDKYAVHTEFMGRYDILEQKIIASVMANKTPDLAQMYEGTTVLLTQDKGEESLLALDDLLAEWGEFDDFFDVFVRNSTYADGRVYSLPFNKSFPVLFYNEQVLRLIGREQPPATWEELMEFAALVQDTIVYDKKNRVLIADSKLKSQLQNIATADYEPMAGYGFSVDPWHFLKMVLQYGGKFMNEQGNAANYNSEESFRAMNFYVRAVTEGWGYRSEGYNHQQDFGAQKVAFIITSVVSRKFMEGKLGFPYGVASVPLSGNKKSIMSGTNICIFNHLGEERTQGAWDFLRWLSSAEISAEWARESFYVPIRKSSLNLPEMKQFLSEVKGSDAAIVQLEHGESEPSSAAWYRCRIILRSYMERIISIVERGNPDPEKVIRDNLQEANILMNRELSRLSLD